MLEKTLESQFEKAIGENNFEKTLDKDGEYVDTTVKLLYQGFKLGRASLVSLEGPEDKKTYVTMIRSESNHGEFAFGCYRDGEWELLPWSLINDLETSYTEEELEVEVATFLVNNIFPKI